MIYYSHVNEDNRIERIIFEKSEFNKAVCVAGSGERVIDLMCSSKLKCVYIIDPNENAIWLTMLKLTALKKLEPQYYLSFIGAQKMSPERRRVLYAEIRRELTNEALAFWDKNTHIIEKGVLHCGQFEQFLARIRAVLRLFLGSQFYTKGISLSKPSKLFPGWRWKLIKKPFEWKWVYKLFGNKDDAFVGSGANVSTIPFILDKQLKDGTSMNSFMYHLIFKGDLKLMKSEDLPTSQDVKSLTDLRERLLNDQIKITYIRNDLKDFLKSFNESVFISASDILSFVPFSYITELLEWRQDHIILRSFIRNRITSEQMDRLKSFGYQITDHTAIEKSGMYQVIELKNGI